MVVIRAEEEPVKGRKGVGGRFKPENAVRSVGVLFESILI